MDRKVRLLRRYILLLVMGMLVSSVSPGEVLAGEAAQETITFAYSAISPVMAGVWMAKEVGAFERHGLKVDLIYIRTGPTVIQAILGGSIQAALAAPNAVVAAVLQEAPVMAVASATSRPAMSLWVQPEITRPEQLQGKTLGITRYGSTGEFISKLVLRRLGLEGKVTMRQFGGQVEADVGFRARQADARVSSQKPTPQARMLVDAAELGIPFSMDLLVVSNKFYRSSPRSVEKIVMAYIEGVAALRTRKSQALKVLGKYMRERGGAEEEHYEYGVRYLDRVPRVDPAAIETSLEMLGHSGGTTGKFFDNSIVDKLDQDGFIERLYKESVRR